MPFRYGYVTAQNGKVHAVAVHDKIVEIFKTEQEARDAADRLNRQERSLKTPSQKAEWLRKWAAAPDRRSLWPARRNCPGSASAPAGSPDRTRLLHPLGKSRIRPAPRRGNIPDGKRIRRRGVPAGRDMERHPQSVTDCFFLVNWRGNPGRWTDQEWDMAVVMPFILLRLDPERIKDHLPERACEPEYWLNRAAPPPGAKRTTSTIWNLAYTWSTPNPTAGCTCPT